MAAADARRRGRRDLAFAADLLLGRVRRAGRAALPRRWLRRWDARRNDAHRDLAISQLLAGEAFPWTSPNLWRAIVEFYRALASPRLLEFGMGASTLWHLRELRQMRAGTYTGVESSPAWFWVVVAAILKDAGGAVEGVSLSRTETAAGFNLGCTVQGVTIELRLRPAMPAYLDPLNEPQDLVVIDGIARRECTRATLEHPPFRREGLLVLMEAGRGRRDWWEGRLAGEADYSAEVDTMLRLGGFFVDGDGLDSWPGCPRRSPRPVSYYYPREACLLRPPYES